MNGFNPHLRPNAGTVGASPFEFDLQPGVAVAIVEVKTVQLTERARYPRIEKTILINIDSGTHAALRTFVNEAAGANPRKGAVTGVMVQERAAARAIYQQVKVAVVVEI